MVQRATPYGNFNFQVQFEGIEAGFSEVSGLGSETEIIEYRNGNSPVFSTIKLPGLTKYGNVTLKRGLTGNLDLWEWRKAIIAGQPDRRDGRILLLDEAGTVVVTWKLFSCWPAKLMGPDLAASGNEIAIEVLELATDRIELDEV